MGVAEHRAASAATRTVAYAVLTVSDSRTAETDTSGPLIRRLFDEAGHGLVDAELVKNNPRQIQAAVRRLLQGPAVCVVLTGGTGAGPRDITVDTVRPLLEKELPGFGELFRWLSYQEIGSAAVMSRALCGVSREKVVYCLPGSEAAVRLAVGKLILPELPHLIWTVRR